MSQYRVQPDLSKASFIDEDNKRLLSSPIEGQLWFNTTRNSLFVFDGTGWNELNISSELDVNWGTVCDGEQIPLPINSAAFGSPYTYKDCAWFVSPRETDETFEFMVCQTDENANVTMKYKDVGSSELRSASANYMIVAISGNTNVGRIIPCAVPEPTPEASVTPSVTLTITPTPTVGVSTTAVPTPTPTRAPSSTPDATPTNTPEPGVTQTATPIPSTTPQATVSVTPTPPVTPTVTPTATPAATPPVTPTVTPTASSTGGPVDGFLRSVTFTTRGATQGSAGHSINSNGTITSFFNSGIGSSLWYSPATPGIGSNYWIQIESVTPQDPLFGTGTFSPPAGPTRYSLNGSPTFTVVSFTDFSPTEGEAFFTFVVNIWDAPSGGNIVATGTLIANAIHVNGAR